MKSKKTQSENEANLQTQIDVLNAAQEEYATNTLANTNNNTSNGGTSSSNTSYTIYDGNPSDNIIVISANTKGAISVNLFEYSLNNSYITIKASGTGYVRHGTLSSDGVANASASITNVKVNYLTLGYE